MTSNRIVSLETPPQRGKYHVYGLRGMKRSYSPDESRQHTIQSTLSVKSRQSRLDDYYVRKLPMISVAKDPGFAPSQRNGTMEEQTPSPQKPYHKPIIIQDSNERTNRKETVAMLMEQMFEHPFSAIKDDDDRRVLANFMFENHFESYNEYMANCSELGISLLNRPYEYFNIQRKKQVITVADRISLQEKKRLQILVEDLDHKTTLEKQQKKWQKQEKLIQKQHQTAQERKASRILAQQNKERQQREQELHRIRNMKRQIGIEKHRRELRALATIIVKQEPSTSNPIIKDETTLQYHVDQSLLRKPMNMQALSEYRVMVERLIRQANSDANQTISNRINEINERRTCTRNRNKEARMQRQQENRTPQENALKQLNDFEYSDLSSDSAWLTLAESTVKKKEPTRLVLTRVESSESSDSFSLSDSESIKERSKHFTIIKGSSQWLAIPQLP